MRCVRAAPPRSVGAVVAVALLVFSGGLAGFGSFDASRPSIRTVRISAEGTAMAVTIEADGPLPSPQVGVLSDPPRIYLDFPGVGAATDGMRGGEHTIVRGVRVGVNQARPLVTRVVVDLLEPLPHSIDAGLRELGRLTIVVSKPPAQPAPAALPPEQSRPVAVPANGLAPVPPQPQPRTDIGTAAAPAAPAIAAPSMPAPAAVASTPAAPPASGIQPEKAADRAHAFSEFALSAHAAAARAPEKDVNRYLTGASSYLQRLENLRPVLVSLDALAAVPEERLKDVPQEFDAVDRGLSAIEVPASVRMAHEELRRVCALGAAAARARFDRTGPDEVTRARNAASAAAGAMMLLERARAELGMRPLLFPGQ